MEKNYKLYHGDCLDKLKELEDNSIDSIVTDPPYGLGFMGKDWDTFDKSQFGIQGEEGENDLKNKKNFKILPRYNNDGLYQFSKDWAIECYRVLKPGGHLLSFAGSRTYHKICMGIEDAGFEIRDQIMWIYGSGFPKSHNIGKAVDKLQGNQRQVVGSDSRTAKDACWGKADPNSPNYDGSTYGVGEWDVTKGNSPWEGWGTALKPAHEPIVMARKPFKGSVAENVLEWGTGGINVDGCRISVDMDREGSNAKRMNKTYSGSSAIFGQADGDTTFSGYDMGRFPANFILECTCDNPIVKENTNQPYTYKDKNYSEQGFLPNVNAVAPYNYNDTNSGVAHTDPNCPCYILDKQSGKQTSTKWNKKHNDSVGGVFGGGNMNEGNSYGDTGGASRFFYCPKVSKKERDEGMEGKVPVFTGRPRREDGSVIYKETHAEEWAEAMKDKPRKDKTSLAAAEEKLQVSQVYAANQTTSKIGANPSKPTEPRANIHPTVKPTELMTYLIRLVTPKDGIVLDPFMGSGSTGKAAMREGFQFVGIEREQEYMQIAEQRIDYEYNKRKFF